MSKIIIGCDPDADKSGIAFYINNELCRLECMTLIDIYIEFESISQQWSDKEIELHIENVKGNSSAFTGMNARQPLPVKMKMAQKVGMCKQVQTEIERIADHFGIKVIHHPISKQWKKNKGMFEKLTGWTGRSNEDSRSGAYMGYLGLTQSK